MKEDILKLLKELKLTPEEEKFYANILTETEQMVESTTNLLYYEPIIIHLPALYYVINKQT